MCWTNDVVVIKGLVWYPRNTAAEGGGETGGPLHTADQAFT
jgi:hypothetical protein